MTVYELADRLDKNPEELRLWLAEDLLRDEEGRDRAMIARAKAAIRA